MKQQISFSQFYDAFEIRRRNFSYEGLKVLYDYLINLEEDTGQEVELDVIALCCDYNEYSDLDEYLNDYSNSHDKRNEEEDEEDFKTRIEEEINDNTTLIKIGSDLDDGFIIQAY